MGILQGRILKWVAMPSSRESSQPGVAFVHKHQQPYLPALVRALQDYISDHQEAGDSASQQVNNCQGLLAALDPEGIWSITLSPEALLQHGRYEDCRAACSRALEATPTGCRPQGRHALHTRQGLGQKLLLLSLHTPVFLPGESQGRGSLVGYRLWGRTELDTTEAT